MQPRKRRPPQGPDRESDSEKLKAAEKERKLVAKLLGMEVKNEERERARERIAMKKEMGETTKQVEATASAVRVSVRLLSVEVHTLEKRLHSAREHAATAAREAKEETKKAKVEAANAKEALEKFAALEKQAEASVKALQEDLAQAHAATVAAETMAAEAKAAAMRDGGEEQQLRKAAETARLSLSERVQELEATVAEKEASEDARVKKKVAKIKGKLSKERERAEAAEAAGAAALDAASAADVSASIVAKELHRAEAEVKEERRKSMELESVASAAVFGSRGNA